jgi:hypothetical protein
LRGDRSEGQSQKREGTREDHIVYSLNELYVGIKWWFMVVEEVGSANEVQKIAKGRCFGGAEVRVAGDGDQ